MINSKLISKLSLVPIEKVVRPSHVRCFTCLRRIERSSEVFTSGFEAPDSSKFFHRPRETQRPSATNVLPPPPSGDRLPAVSREVLQSPFSSPSPFVQVPCGGQEPTAAASPFFRLPTTTPKCSQFPSCRSQTSATRQCWWIRIMSQWCDSGSRTCSFHPFR